MKVKELIEFLQKFDPELPVYSCGADVGGYDVEFGELNEAYKISELFIENGKFKKDSPIIYHAG